MTYPYHYTATDPGIELHLEARTAHRTHYVATLPAGTPKSDGVFGELFLPRSSERVPLAILVPGFGDESAVPCLLMARHLVKQGIAAFTLYTVFTTRRTSEAIDHSLLSTAAECLGGFSASVNDIRRIVGWASHHDGVDGKRIAIIGASMGGMISAIAMALEQRISAGVFMITGGNLEEMSWGGARHLSGMGHQCTREECREVYSHYAHFLNEVAVKGLPNVTPAKECFLFDPITFAPLLRGRPVLMLNGLEDEIVSRRSAGEFWEACGRPRMEWLPTTHAGIYAQQAITHKEVTDFLKSAFSM